MNPANRQRQVEDSRLRWRKGWDWLGGISLTSLLVLLLAILASCGNSSGFANAGTPDAPEAPTVSTVAARLGDIEVRSNYVAQVEAKDQVDLVPVTTGRIARLYVDVGAEVNPGQVLAELDHGTLDLRLEEAEAALLGERAKLDSVRASFEPNRSQAIAKLDAANAGLEQLTTPSPTDIRTAQSAVDKAASELDSARTRLHQLKNPTEVKLVSAQLGVAEAESQLSQAQTEVNQAIREQLNATETSMPEEVRWWWRALLDARLLTQANRATLQNLRSSFELDLTTREIDTANQVIQQNQKVIPALLAQIESSSVVPQQITNVMWAETAAVRKLEVARAELGELQRPDESAVALAQYRVDAVQATLEGAKAKLDLLRNPTLAQLAAARTQVAEAERAVALSDHSYVALEIEAARSLVEQAEAKVSLVEQQLADTRILAPFAGLVVQKWLAPGALATTQTPVVSLNSREIVVSIQVEETALSQLHMESTMVLTSPALPGRPIPLQIRHIAPSGNEPEHTFSVQLEPSERVPDLRPGISGQVSLETRPKSVVLIPRDALVFPENQPHVFVAEAGRAHLRRVETGIGDWQQIEIRQGIAAGEQIIVGGLEQVTHGISIAPVEMAGGG
ncbi:MAG: efflux RND transporter periplasmic adaptor subunit [Dehalococcoidia bacterium]